MNIIRKDASIENVGPDDAFPGEFRVVLSTEDLDRDGDTLLAEEWKTPLPEHITFDTDHGMSVTSVVGSGAPAFEEIDGKQAIVVEGTYSSIDRAQEVRTLVNEKHIRTTSVAFRTIKSGKGAGAKSMRELLNGAFVAVPANTEAKVLESKSFDLKVGARNSKNDAALVQTILDAAVALGADPESTKAYAPVGLKSIMGSVEALQDRLRDELRETYPGKWPWVRATFPDEGYLVFDIYDYELGAGNQSYRQSFTDDGSVVTLTGTPEAVDVMEVITPEPSEEGKASKSAGAVDEPGAGATAPAPGTKTAPTTDEAAAELKVKSARFRALIASSTTSPEGN